MLRRLILLLVLAWASVARAGDPSQVWETIESPHFVIHYYRPNGDYARRLAVDAEKAYAKLTVALRHVPGQKTHIVVTDDTDGANGFAQVVPRNQVNVYVSAPDAIDTLNDRDDSIYGLIAHEFTHILHLDTISGVPWLYNQIFGKTWAPNEIQPRWFIEGLATYEESKRSSGGRLRNALFEGWLRTEVLANEDLGLDRISSSDWFYPHGNLAYLHGSFFLDYIASRFGDGVLAAMSHDYGNQPVPFALNRTAKRATGETFEELWRDWQQYLKEKYALQVQAATARGLVIGRQLTDEGESHSWPRYTRDGKEIWWQRYDGWSRPQYRRTPVGAAPGADTQLAIVDGAASYSELPDGSGMILDVGFPYRTIYGFTDLFRYDFASGRLTRLSWGGRLSGNTISPDGKWIAAAKNGGGRSTIIVMPSEGGPQRVVWQGGRWDNAFEPVYSPDGTKLAFCAWTQGGDQDIYVVDVATGQTQKLTDDRAMEAQPRWSADGKWVYFTSDRSGIYNVYAIELARSGVIKQLTNVLGGVLTFDVSPDGKRLVYEGIDARGDDVWEIDGIDAGTAPEAEVYVNDRPDPELAPDGGVPISKPRPYDPFETLAPLAYTLQLAQDAFGNAVSIGVTGGDVVGFHRYALGVTVGLDDPHAVAFGAGYAYNRLWPSLRLAFSRGTGLAGGMTVNGIRRTWHDEVWQGTAAVGLPVLRRPSIASDLSLEYDLDWVRNTDKMIPVDPNAPIPSLPAIGVNAGAALRWGFSTVRRFVFTLGPTEGYAGSIGLRLNSKVLGSDYDNITFTYGWQQYFRMPWPGDQILAVRLNGGIQGGRVGTFALGGPGYQDLVSAIVNSTRAGTSYFHGYSAQDVRGPQFHLLNLEYRAPLWSPERGPSTVPIYANRLHLAGLFDVGNAFSGNFDASKLRVGIGAALRLDLTFGYGAGGTLEAGIARGVSQDGQTQTWLLLTTGL